MSAPILIIKHGAFGDLILATRAFEKIRAHHPHQKIFLLTDARYYHLTEEMPYFDEIIIDPRGRTPYAFFKFMAHLRTHAFTRVYDLQNSTRTSFYFKVLKMFRRLEWSGIARGCSHPQMRPDREQLSTHIRLADQLRASSIDVNQDHELWPDVSWMKADVSSFHLMNKRYALIVPGCSAKNQAKRWPLPCYLDLCHWLIQMNIKPVIVGGHDTTEMAKWLQSQAQDSVNLCGQTSFAQLAELARGACVAIGNDTGPSHLIAAAGCPIFLAWSNFSDASVYAPPGSHVHVVQQDDLSDLSAPRMCQELKQFLSSSERLRP